MNLSQRLRVDLTQAMKNRDRARAKALRSVLTALDNATAVDHDSVRHLDAVEVDRRHVTEPEMQAILNRQIAEREEARDVYAAHDQDAKAAELSHEISVLREYRE